MKPIVAYLINQYPRVSHTFIRREIEALEVAGLTVARFSIRRNKESLADEADQAEQERTEVILKAGLGRLLMALLGSMATRPRRFLLTLTTALRLGRQSERGFMIHLIYLAEACLLRCWLADRNAEHLHAHFGTNPATVALLCRLLGGPPYSFTVHGPEEFDAPRALSLGEKVRHASFVVAVSDFGRSQLYRWTAYEDWPKLAVVHCGVDTAFLDAPRCPVPEAPRLVCVGRLAEQKGQLLLIEAAARLRDRGLELEIVLIGKGPMRGEIQDLIERLDLTRIVRLIGSMDGEGVRREIFASRALVLPSFAEGLPVVLMEALALGRPVISTYVAGIPELVEPGKNGWLVPAGSVEALADAMAEALSSEPAELDRMGRSGAARVAERHDASTEARRLAALMARSTSGSLEDAKRNVEIRPQTVASANRNG